MPPKSERITYGPQPLPGRRIEETPQYQYARSSADIVIFGGGAGGGKSYMLLVDPVRYLHPKSATCTPGFRGVVFKRQLNDVRKAGGLWDEASGIYPRAYGAYSLNPLLWRFSPDQTLEFNGLETEGDKYKWDTAQLTFVGFDQLEQFTEGQFWYLNGRLRRGFPGVRPHLRANCNPHPDSFLATLLDWWIDDEGWAIPERSGRVRFLTRIGEEVVWGDDRTELAKHTGLDPWVDIQSLTFIRSRLKDNPALLEKDPRYRARLNMLPHVERMRLLGDIEKGGNWKVRPGAGKVFNRDWFEVVGPGDVPALRARCRGWDLAATKVDEKNTGDPSWTAGVRMSRTEGGDYVVENARRRRDTPGQIEAWVRRMAEQDGRDCAIGLFQDPGQAGKAQAHHYSGLLDGWTVLIDPIQESKLQHASAYAGAVEHGRVKLLQGPWNEAFLTEHHNFDGTDKGHADQVDGASRAYRVLSTKIDLLPMLGGVSLFSAEDDLRKSSYWS